MKTKEEIECLVKEIMHPRNLDTSERVLDWTDSIHSDNGPTAQELAEAEYLAECVRLREAFESDAGWNESVNEAANDWDADATSASLGIERYRERLRGAISRPPPKKRTVTVAEWSAGNVLVWSEVKPEGYWAQTGRTHEFEMDDE